MRRGTVFTYGGHTCTVLDISQGGMGKKAKFYIMWRNEKGEVYEKLFTRQEMESLI